MRSSSKNNPVRTVRRICRLTQAELAKMIGCARLTITTLESGKLKISEKMAEKIALHTGASRSWLLGNNTEVAAGCVRDLQRPLTAEGFLMRRAGVGDPRVDRLDVRQSEDVVGDRYSRV